jgi:hypothetical protein
MRSVPRPLLPVVLLVALAGGLRARGDDAAPPRQPPPRITLAGTLILPDVAPGPDGRDLPITGLSGITWLGEDRYAAIMDNSDRLLLLRIRLSPRGVPEKATDLEIVVLGRSLDYEDLAPCPEPLAARIAARRQARGEAAPGRCLLVCEETTPAIRAVELDSGTLLGIVPIPEIMETRRPNRGLEALAVDPEGDLIWTATEEAVPADGPPATSDAGTVVRLARIPVPAADGQAQGPAATRQFAYAVDPPHRFFRIFAGEPLSGVVAMVALGGDRLLVLERSGAPGLPPFEKRIYLVDASAGTDVADLAGGLDTRADLHLTKERVWHDTLGCNVEGLCLGPELAAGGRALLAVADNGGLGTPNQLVALVLHEQPAPVDASWIGAGAVLAGLALLFLRLTSP